MIRRTTLAILCFSALAIVGLCLASFSRAFAFVPAESDDYLCMLLVAEGQLEIRQSRLGEVAPFPEEVQTGVSSYFVDFKNRLRRDLRPSSHFDGRSLYHKTRSRLTVEQAPTPSHPKRVRRKLLHSAATGFPIWLTVPALLAYPAIAFIRGPLRRWRWRRKGCCRNCGYDLTGNTSGVCPECGKPI